MSRTLLLNPGPVTLSARVREALLRPDLCHREIEFSSLQGAIRAALLKVYDLDATTWAAVLLTGSGTAAVEAMLTSTVPRSGRLLVVENGVYGERMSMMAERAGIATARCATSWESSLRLAAVEAQLDAFPDTTHVAVVHHETTTGRLNDLHALGALCAARGVDLLLDAVSSFGAENIDFHALPIAACAATANKCLHGVPGVSFVILNRQRFAGSGTPARSVYLDLGTYLTQQERGGTPFTQSVQGFYALHEALAEFAEAGGQAARQQLYRTRMTHARATLAGLGVEGILPEADCSCVLHAFRLPGGQGYEELHAGLKARGFVIYAGQGRLAADIFRISLMGDLTTEDLARLAQAFRELLTRD